MLCENAVQGRGVCMCRAAVCVRGVRVRVCGCMAGKRRIKVGGRRAQVAAGRHGKGRKWCGSSRAGWGVGRCVCALYACAAGGNAKAAVKVSGVMRQALC